MAGRTFILDEKDPPPRKRNDLPETRARIVDALFALLAEGERPNHDAVAARAGLSRRTVYRYYPDQRALREAMEQRLAPSGGTPASLDQMLGGLHYVFRLFDRREQLMMVAMSSLEGRAVRNEKTPERAAAYRAMLAERTAGLPEQQATAVIALVQLLASGLAWREMRDQWDMEGEASARACRWAIETLLAAAEKGEGPPAD